MNTIPSFAKSVTLRGRISAELIPAKNWRELALKGVKSMSYRISGQAEIDGVMRHVNIHIPAVSDGQIAGLGTAVPAGAKTQDAVEFISALCPKNGPLDTARVLEQDGSSVIGEDGRPVYAEAAIPGFDLAFGTHYFCPTNGGLTLTVEDAGIRPSERRVTVDGIEQDEVYLDIRGLSHTVVTARVDRANGAPLVKFTAAKQAARRTAEALAPTQTTISM
jgi:hypothetical protein